VSNSPNIDEYLLCSFFSYRKKLGAKLTGKRDDADTDSYSDTDFNEVDDLEKSLDVDEDKNRKKTERINLELLEKRYRNI
jgi:hypothetical protein